MCIKGGPARCLDLSKPKPERGIFQIGGFDTIRDSRDKPHNFLIISNPTLTNKISIRDKPEHDKPPQFPHNIIPNVLRFLTNKISVIFTETV